jgi:hypothetical protein
MDMVDPLLVSRKYHGASITIASSIKEPLREGTRRGSIVLPFFGPPRGVERSEASVQGFWNAVKIFLWAGNMGTVRWRGGRWFRPLGKIGRKFLCVEKYGDGSVEGREGLRWN